MLFGVVLDKDCGPVESPVFVAGTASGGQRASGRLPNNYINKLGPLRARAWLIVPDLEQLISTAFVKRQLARVRFNRAAVNCTAGDGDLAALEAIGGWSRAI